MLLIHSIMDACHLNNTSTRRYILRNIFFTSIHSITVVHNQNSTCSVFTILNLQVCLYILKYIEKTNENIMVQFVCCCSIIYNCNFTVLYRYTGHTVPCLHEPLTMEKTQRTGNSCIYTLAQWTADPTWLPRSCTEPFHQSCQVTKCKSVKNSNIFPVFICKTNLIVNCSLQLNLDSKKQEECTIVYVVVRPNLGG